LPEITEPVTITGPGANVLTVNALGQDGLFDIGSGLAASEISGLTLTGSYDDTFDSDVDAVTSESPLTLSGDTLSGNEGVFGAAIFSTDGLTVANSTINDNEAEKYGGAIENIGPMTITGSTIDDNDAGYYQGDYGNGGGIRQSGGALTITGSTITDNYAEGDSSDGYGRGGGLYIESNTTSVALQNTIVSGNYAKYKGDDLYTETGGSIVPTAEFSLIGDLTYSGITPDSTDLTDVDPLLGRLQNNGGSTETLAPAFNSPVIDQGKAFGETTDERGFARPTDLPGYANATGGDGSDMGAVELQPIEVVPIVTKLSVSSGAAGTQVVITGQRLSTATGVLFGSTPATTFTINTLGQVIATAPAGPTGTVDVRVVSPGGESPAVAADHFAYPSAPVPPTPTPTPVPTITTTSAKFDNQQITLVTPVACTASTSSLRATLSSSAISGSHATKVKFSAAGFFIDKGVKHTKKKTEHLKNGKTKHVTVTSYTANVTEHALPATVSLKLKGLKAGTHTLKIVISYKETVTKKGKKKTETVTKTITSKFKVC
jgi:hypothetical protein